MLGDEMPIPEWSHLSVGTNKRVIIYLLGWLGDAVPWWIIIQTLLMSKEKEKKNKTRRSAPAAAESIFDRRFVPPFFELEKNAKLSIARSSQKKVPMLWKAITTLSGGLYGVKTMLSVDYPFVIEYCFSLHFL